MLRILSFIFLTTLSTDVWSKSSDWDYKLGLNINAFSVDSDKLRAKIWTVKPDLKTSIKLDHNISFLFDFGAILESGSNRSLGLINEYSPEQKLYIAKAYFDIALFSSYKVEIGAINQEIYRSPLFLSNLAFLGLRESYQFKITNFKFKLFASQSIPNNDSLSSRLSIVEEGTPLFYAETLELQYEINNFKILTAYTHYNFKNISRNIAFQSRYLGNTTTGTTEDNAAFLYDYQGHNSLLEFSYSSVSFYTSIKALFLHNNLAPNSKADALYLALRVGHPHFFAVLEKYTIESDATIAYYNSGDYGHTNRRGHAIGLTYIAKEYETSMLLHNQDVILSSSLYQTKRNVINLNFKKTFE